MFAEIVVLVSISKPVKSFYSQNAECLWTFFTMDILRRYIPYSRVPSFAWRCNAVLFTLSEYLISRNKLSSEALVQLNAAYHSTCRGRTYWYINELLTYRYTWREKRKMINIYYIVRLHRKKIKSKVISSLKFPLLRLPIGAWRWRAWHGRALGIVPIRGML